MHESGPLRRVRALAHTDDQERAQTYRRLFQDDGPSYDDLAPTQRAYTRMLFFSLWPNGGGFSSYADGFDAFRQEHALRDELLEVTDFAVDHARHRALRLTGRLSDLPLRVHAQYKREESSPPSTTRIRSVAQARSNRASCTPKNGMSTPSWSP